MHFMRSFIVAFGLFAVTFAVQADVGVDSDGDSSVGKRSIPLESTVSILTQLVGA